MPRRRRAPVSTAATCPSRPSEPRRELEPGLVRRRRVVIGALAPPRLEGEFQGTPVRSGSAPDQPPAEAVVAPGAGRYLASFAWRYNRRYQLQTMISRFVHSAARNQPMPYRLLIAG